MPPLNVLDFMTAAQRRSVAERRREIDVTDGLQRALDAAAGSVLLPAGDYVVNSSTRKPALFIQRKSLFLTGDRATIVWNGKGNGEALRVEECFDFVLDGLRFQGAGFDGINGDRGMVQFYLGKGLTIRNCAFDGAVCDGLAVAGVDGVVVTGCSSRNASKSGLYVNNCHDVQVVGNHVTEFGGHRAERMIVGAGLQLSGNRNLVASGNVISNGTGLGILCNESGTVAPFANAIIRNAVDRVSNPQNTGLSGGIRIANAAQDRKTETLVRGNTVQECALYNYYFENHDDIVVEENVGVASWESNYIFSRLQGARVNRNSAIDSNASNRPGQTDFYVINQSRRVIGSGNRAVIELGGGARKSRPPVEDNTGNPNRIDFLDQA